MKAMQELEGFKRRLVGPAFTLVELLVVVAIAVAIIAIAIPAMNGLGGASGVNKLVADVAGTLEEARAYAMAQNTFVWVGITEVDAGQDPSSPSQRTGTGRVALAVIASKDGTKIYDDTDPAQSWAAAYGTGGRLVQIGKLIKIENAHLAESLGAIPGSGNMARPAVSAGYQLGNAECVSLVRFSYPLGKTLDNGQYNFQKVIQFDPQGAARIVQGFSNYAPMEICLQQSRGSVLPPILGNANVGNHAAVQVDGMTGAIRLYRP